MSHPAPRCVNESGRRSALPPQSQPVPGCSPQEGSWRLEIEQVGQFDDQRAPSGLIGQGVQGVVVDNVEIAQRVVDEIETEVRAEELRIRVVLDERIQEGARREPVNEPRPDELGRECAARQMYPVA